MPSYINFQDDSTYPGHKFRRMMGRQQDLAQGFDDPKSFKVSVSNDRPGMLESAPGISWVRDEMGGVYFVEREIEPLYVNTVGTSGTVILRVLDIKAFDGENGLVLEVVAEGQPIPVRSLRLATYVGAGSDAVLTDVRLSTQGQFIVSRSGPSNYGAPSTEVMGLGHFSPGTQYTDLNTGVRYVKATDGTWFQDKGPKGDRGETGPKGEPGADSTVPGPDGPKGDTGDQGPPGPDGDSAYDVAVVDGFEGTETEWLASLVGPEGPQGVQGEPGKDGTGSGTVSSVNEVEPDGQGNVTLTADDVNALPSSQKGVANGVASLGDDGKVPAEQLPTIGGGDGTVVSVNTIGPDELGNVTLTAADVEALGEDGYVPYGNITLDSPDGNYRGFTFRTANVYRWAFQVQPDGEDPETGADFELANWSDAGDWKSSVLFGKRETGQLGIGTTEPVPDTKLTVDGATAFNDVAAAPAAPEEGAILYSEGGELKVVTPTSRFTLGPGGGGTTPFQYSPEGFYVPDSWGTNWRNKLQGAADGGKARMLVVGGSSSQGFYASNLHSGGWVGNVRAGLQAKYGDGGSGFFSTSRGPNSIAGSYDAAALAAWQGNGSAVTVTGTWTTGGNRNGPGITQIYTVQPDASMTFKVTGTAIKIYTTMGAGRADYTYSIDGATPVTVANSPTETLVAVTEVPTVGPGEHTVVLTHTGAGGSSNYLTVIGVSGENTSGVVVENLAKAGAESSSYTGSATVTQWNGGTSYPADLVVFTAGPNDAATETGSNPPVVKTTAEVWDTNVRAYIAAVKSANPAADIMILLPHYGVHSSWEDVYAEYADKALAIHDEMGIAFVDMWTNGQRSWEYWNTLGYWGDNTNPGGSGNNSVHPGDAGYAYEAGVLLPLLG